ncbi:gliotoxin thiomethyltransferase [Aspergillus candidus]|uniref:Putative UbiE/COQ5 family methyltransferase n=1 Tax=Aspergillus candidus TaxID=41067 RepID=A0A2I2EYK3_ASPCN|nr:putative UbiE/COQ5 family methyltransferase [Aspergillus candidus]PLB33453.1 putative UbiE/COQ5 family methyltransferase [Aspergillus candidus]
MGVYTQKGIVPRYIVAEKITGLFAQPLIDQSGIATSFQKPLVVLDNACGTGIVSSFLNQKIHYKTRKRWKLVCSDLTQEILDYTRQRIRDEAWMNAKAKLVDAQDTGLPNEYFTHVFVGFAFNTFLDEMAAMNECFRILKPGGTLAISTWQSTDWLTLIESAIMTIPDNLPFPSTKEFFALYSRGWHSKSYVRAQLETAGFRHVQTTSVNKQISLPISEFMEVVMSIVPVVAIRFWTQEQRTRYQGDVPGVVRRYLEGRFGVLGLVVLEPWALVTTGLKV